MHRSAQISIGCLLFLFIVSACSKPIENSVNQPASSNTQSTPKRVTSVGVVHATARPAEVSQGGSGELIVALKIDSGYHVNANPPTFRYLIATQLDVPASDGISVSAVSYPAALTKTFAFADKPLSVYEGDTEIKAKLNADRTATKGEHSVPAQLQVQACDDQVCYPPGKIELRIPVTVK